MARGTMIGALSFAAILVLSSASAVAARFDCGKAQSPVDKQICTNPAVAAADVALVAAYRQVLAPLSEEARAKVRQGERDWVQFVQTICPAGDEIAACLTENYAERQAQLETSVVKRGDLAIYGVASFTAQKSDEPTGDDSGAFDTTRISFPQLDRPTGDGARAWNERMATTAKDLAATADGDEIAVDYELQLTLPTLLSGQFTVSSYAHHAAHPTAQLVSFKWLVAQGRPLQADDIFDHATPWKQALSGFCAAAFADFDEPDKFCAPDKLDFDSWTVEADGIGLQFQQYEIGPYVEGSPKRVIPWDKLTPYLVANPPFPIPPK